MDPRYKFIRGISPFKGLNDYLKAPNIDVKKKTLRFPIPALQLSMMEARMGQGLPKRLGMFFEILAQGIYGGRIGEVHELSEENGNEITSEPDIIHYKTNCIREVKGAHFSSEIKLRDEQMERYALLQVGNYFPDPPVIKFEIFRHKVQGLLKIFEEDGLEGLVYKLSKNVRAMFSLPFSIVYRIYASGSKFTSRYEGDYFHTLTRFNSRGLNTLLAYPRQGLENFGINPNNFIIEKTRSPPDVRMNGARITPFPILSINEKDSQRELEGLKRFMGGIEDTYSSYTLKELLEGSIIDEREKDEIPFEIPDAGEDYDIRQDGLSEIN